MFRRSIIIIAGCLAFATSAEAKTWSGKWGGQSASTLTFVANKQVRYCFQSQCVVRSYVGDPEKAIRFRWGSASLAFRRTSTGYSGTHTANGNVSRIEMK